MSREIDRLVAEKVMGIVLKPSPDLAIARVGRRYVCSTGRVFTLTDGRRLVMPPGDDLRQPEGSTDPNDRYFMHVGEALLPGITDEVNEYRLSAAPYSTDIAAAWTVVERMREKGWNGEVSCLQGTMFAEKTCAARFGKKGQALYRTQATFDKSAPRAICFAALRALAVEEADRAIQVRRSSEPPAPR